MHRILVMIPDFTISLNNMPDLQMEEMCKCIICLMIPDPESAVCHGPCGRVFCSSCIEHAFRLKQICPFCQRSLTRIPRKVKEKNYFVYKMMMDMIVFCPNQDQGCGWKGVKSKLNSHLEQCAYRMIDCPLKCGESIFNNFVSQHIEVCKNAKIQCKECKKFIFIGDWNLHKCVSLINFCPLKGWGCSYSGSSDAIIRHLSRASYEHNNLLNKYIENEVSKASKKMKIEYETTFLVKESKIQEDLSIQKNKLHSFANVEDTKIDLNKQDSNKEEKKELKEKAKKLSVIHGGKKGAKQFIEKNTFDGNCPKQHKMKKLLSGKSNEVCEICKKNTLYHTGGLVCIKCDYYVCSECNT